MASPREKLQSRLEMLPGLPGRAAVSHDYGRWVDGSHHLLVTLSCEESPQARGFLEVVGKRAEARGWGLPLAPGSPWGMQARLDRAEEYLRRAPWGRSAKPSSSRPWPAPPPPPAPRPLHRAAAMDDRPVTREPVTIVVKRIGFYEDPFDFNSFATQLDKAIATADVQFFLENVNFEDRAISHRRRLAFYMLLPKVVFLCSGEGEPPDSFRK